MSSHNPHMKNVLQHLRTKYRHVCMSAFRASMQTCIHGDKDLEDLKKGLPAQEEIEG